jgi:hypothetical protein
MDQTMEALIDERSQVRLLEAIALPGPRRALATVLEEVPQQTTPDMSQRFWAKPLAEDWSRPE